MSLIVVKEQIVLIEKNKEEFSMKVKISHFTNAKRLEYLQFKYLFIQQDGEYLGYVMLAETQNKLSNIKKWILSNIEVAPQYLRRGIGSVVLEKVHQIFSSELGAKSYIVTLNSFIMYKMIVRESLNGKIDFYCLINTEYPVEEMKEEERDLKEIFLQNPNTHADMIVSFDKAETERVKPLYFKVN